METDAGRLARRYHERTKHSYASVTADPHDLDWPNQPLPFKVYEDVEPISLPPEPPRAEAPVLACLASAGEGRPEGFSPRLETLARLFFLTAGVTKKIEAGGGAHYFRAAACTGALYHIEVYLVCGAVPGGGGGLSPGVYHLGAHDYAARRLRGGDFRAVLARAAGEASSPPAYFVFTSTYWRNAWKYRARAYRHCYWDSGTMLANLLAAAAALGVPARTVLGFADAAVNGLLGVDPAQEAALGWVELGRPRERPEEAPAVLPIACRTTPLSASRVDYPLIEEVHAATSFSGPREAIAWRESARAPGGGPLSPPLEGGQAFPLGREEVPHASVDQTILRRGSVRRFDREQPIRFEELSAALRAAAGALQADFLPAGAPALNEMFLIVHAVDGLPPGAYLLDRAGERLRLLRGGDLRAWAGGLGLGQALAAEAAVNVYFLSDLERVLAGLGGRGYRAAQLEAALMGGRLYLAAEGMGFGASGLTFYDDDVVSFFGPAARGKDVMFLLLLGRRRRGRLFRA
ncbi:MAG: SagB/ThcOx family dehydrogenase [Nitrospinota bacterium]